MVFKVFLPGNTSGNYRSRFGSRCKSCCRDLASLFSGSILMCITKLSRLIAHINRRGPNEAFHQTGGGTTNCRCRPIRKLLCRFLSLLQQWSNQQVGGGANQGKSRCNATRVWPQSMDFEEQRCEPISEEERDQNNSICSQPFPVLVHW